MCLILTASVQTRQLFEETERNFFALEETEAQTRALEEMTVCVAASLQYKALALAVCGSHCRHSG